MALYQIAGRHDVNRFGKEVGESCFAQTRLVMDKSRIVTGTIRNGTNLSGRVGPT
jgi:hypothetical protein